MTLLTIDDMARKFDVKPRTIKEWVRKKKLPAIRMSARTIRFDEEQVRESLVLAAPGKSGRARK